MIDYLGVFVVLLCGFVLTYNFCKVFRVSLSRGFLIYCWHGFFCIVYIHYVDINGGDATSYYQVATSLDLDFNVGTASVNLLTSLFGRYIGLSFVAVSFVYNIIGFIGLLAFDGSLKVVSSGAKRNIQRKLRLMVFLPSMSFWSAGIGKDAIAFMAVGLALWASLALHRRWRLMAFSIVLMMLVRPHVAGLMVLALALASIFQKSKIGGVKRWILIVLLVAGSGFAVPFALEYAGLGDASSASDLSDYFETRQGYNQEGGGAINISEMSPPLQLFTYAFRPLPFEAGGVAGLAAAFENVLLMIFFLYAAGCFFRNPKKIMRYEINKVFLIIFPLMTWLVLAMTTANLGISLRQKWMFMPMLMCMASAAIAAVHPIRSRSFCN